MKMCLLFCASAGDLKLCDIDDDGSPATSPTTWATTLPTGGSPTKTPTTWPTTLPTGGSPTTSPTTAQNNIVDDIADDNAHDSAGSSYRQHLLTTSPTVSQTSILAQASPTALADSIC